MSRWHRDNPEAYEELGEEGYYDLLASEADYRRDRELDDLAVQRENDREDALIAREEARLDDPGDPDEMDRRADREAPW